MGSKRKVKHETPLSGLLEVDQGTPAPATKQRPASRSKKKPPSSKKNKTVRRGQRPSRR